MPLLTGMIVGFFVAAPLGPIDMLCIQKSLHRGMRTGFFTGFGAAFADVIWASLAALGLVAFKECLFAYQIPLGCLGGLFLLTLGYRTYTSQGFEGKEELESTGAISGFFTTFFLTLLSPTTLLSFSGVFAILGIDMDGAGKQALIFLVTGVFLGSTFWWMILSSVVSYFRGSLEVKQLGWINRFSGIFLLGFGLLVLLQSAHLLLTQ